MNKFNKVLIVFFAAQLALALVTWTMCQSKPVDTEAEPFLSLSVGDITGLKIVAKAGSDDKPAETVQLALVDGAWVLSAAENYKAEQDKVKDILEKLVELKVREPVATQAANHNALNVGALEFGRKVTLTTNSGAQTFIVGSGKGSSVHLRKEGEDDVYRSGGLSVWNLNASMRHFIDTEYVKVDQAKVATAVVRDATGRTLTFTRMGEEWALAEMPEGTNLDQTKAGSFIGQVAKLDINEPVGRAIKPEYGLSGGTTVTVTPADGDSVEYTIGAAQDDQYYYVKAANKDHVVAVSKWSTEQARTKTPADFAAPPSND